MAKDLRPPKLQSSFLSCEKDIEIILKKLFSDNRPYSDILKRLLIINTKDCLDPNNENYKKKIDSMSVKDMIDKGYILLTPSVADLEFDEVKTTILISLNNFTKNQTNDHYRDCTISFEVMSHLSCWDIGNYKIRPLKIIGYIDGLLDNSRLTGIGTFQFMGARELLVDNEFSGYSIMFKAIHGNDDKIPTVER